MKSRSVSAGAFALAIMATIGVARAEDQPVSPESPHPSMMAPRGEGGMMGMGGMMGGMGPGMMMGPGGRMCGAMASHIEGRLAFIKAELKITPEQDGLWESFATVARDNAKTMLSHCAAMKNEHSGQAASLPDRLDRREQSMAAHLDALRAMNKALKPLYAALSESQKHTADQLFWGPMSMM